MRRKFLTRWITSYILGALVAVVATILLTPLMFVAAVGSGGLGAWLWSMMVAVPFGASASFFQVLLLDMKPELTFRWVVLSSIGWASGATAAVALPELTPLDSMSPAIWYLFWLLLGLCVGTAQWLALPRHANSVLWIAVSLAASMSAALTSPISGNVLAALASLVPFPQYLSFASYLLETGLFVAAVVLIYSLITGIGFTLVYRPKLPGAA
jgi:hypothetical protein